jgi:hypothetical protein
VNAALLQDRGVDARAVATGASVDMPASPQLQATASSSTQRRLNARRSIPGELTITQDVEPMTPEH